MGATFREESCQGNLKGDYVIAETFRRKRSPRHCGRLAFIFTTACDLHSVLILIPPTPPFAITGSAVSTGPARHTGQYLNMARPMTFSAGRKPLGGVERQGWVRVVSGEWWRCGSVSGGGGSGRENKI
jgi:hypothetical protein